MKSFYLTILMWASFTLPLNIIQAKEIKLNSKSFQKEFLYKISETMKSTATIYLNNFLNEIVEPANANEEFVKLLKSALHSQRLEPKIVFIKQYLDMEEHKDANRENMYGMRNVNFLKKLKNKLYKLEDESLEEMHQLRYYYLCKQFKVSKLNSQAAHHNYYSKNIQLQPFEKRYVGGGLLEKLDLGGNQTISVNITEFANELYKRVNEAGSEIIDDYLYVIRKLLQEVLEPQLEEEVTVHSEALRKILAEVNILLNIADMYTKRQRLYDYLENHLALDYEQIQSSENSQHDLIEIFNRLKEKGLDLVMAYLFSNFEFIDYLQDQWKVLLPQRAISLYDEYSRPLKQIQELYTEFKMDFENSSKYDAYLEAVKLLHEQTEANKADTSHIYELLYSASQNVGSSRAALMNSKCIEM